MKKLKTIILMLSTILVLLMAGCSQSSDIVDEGDNKLPENLTNNKTIELSPDLSSCKSYFDGCNICFVTNGIIGGCTRMFCETKQEPKCMLYNDEIIIGKIFDKTETTIDILQGDIAQRFQINNQDTSNFVIGDIVEATYNRDDVNNLQLAQIKVYEKPDEGLICTKEYMPVCAQTTIDGNGIPVLETFSNTCMAQNSQIIHQGVCGEDSIKLTENRICTMQYVPVCAKFNGAEKTFGNACGAGELEILYKGECK